MTKKTDELLRKLRELEDQDLDSDDLFEEVTAIIESMEDTLKITEICSALDRWRYDGYVH